MPLTKFNETTKKSEVQIRESITLLLIISACVGFFMGSVTPEFFQNLVLTVIAFYFGNRLSSPINDKPINNQPITPKNNNETNVPPV